MKLRAKGILLDLDGTIVDSRKALMEAAKAAFAATNREMSDPRIVTEIPKRLEQNLSLDDLIPQINAKQFLSVYLTTYHRVTATQARPFPNISDTLDRLATRAKLALITNRHVPKEGMIRELKRLGLAKYFLSIMTAQDTLNPKPSPKALIECSRRLALEASDCVVVGDSVVDIRAGKAAGIKTVAVLSGIFSLVELKEEKPDLILENIEKLLDFLE